MINPNRFKIIMLLSFEKDKIVEVVYSPWKAGKRHDDFIRV